MSYTQELFIEVPVTATGFGIPVSGTVATTAGLPTPTEWSQCYFVTATNSVWTSYWDSNLPGFAWLNTKLAEANISNPPFETNQYSKIRLVENTGDNINWIPVIKLNSRDVSDPSFVTISSDRSGFASSPFELTNSKPYIAIGSNNWTISDSMTHVWLGNPYHVILRGDWTFVRNNDYFYGDLNNWIPYNNPGLINENYGADGSWGNVPTKNSDGLFKRYSLSQNEYNYYVSPSINTTISKIIGDSISASEMGANTCFYTSNVNGVIPVVDPIPTYSRFRAIVANNLNKKTIFYFKGNSFENANSLGDLSEAAALSATNVLPEGIYIFNNTDTSTINSFLIIEFTGRTNIGKGRDYFEVYCYDGIGCIVTSSNFESFMNSTTNTSITKGTMVWIDGQKYGWGISTFGPDVNLISDLPAAGPPTFVNETGTVWFNETVRIQERPGITEPRWVNRYITKENASAAPYVLNTNYATSVKIYNPTPNFQWQPVVVLWGSYTGSTVTSPVTVDIMCERGWYQGFGVVSDGFANASEHRFNYGTIDFNSPVDNTLQQWGQFQVFTATDPAIYRQNVSTDDFQNWQPIGGSALILGAYDDYTKGDGWGNEAKINSEGYMVRYTLSESEYNTKIKSTTIMASGTGLGITYTAIDIAGDYSNAPATPTLNDWIRHLDGSSSVYKGGSVGTNGWVFINAYNDFSNGPYVAGTNNESEINITDPDGNYMLCIALPAGVETYAPISPTTYRINPRGIGTGVLVLSNNIYPYAESGNTNYPNPYAYTSKISRSSIQDFNYDGSWLWQGALASGYSDRSGWGNDPSLNSYNQLTRYTLSESQYYTLLDTVGTVYPIYTGPLTASGKFNINDGFTTTLYNQTILLGTGIFNNYAHRVTLLNDFPVYSKIRFIVSDGNNAFIFLPEGHTLRTTSTAKYIGDWTGNAAGWVNAIENDSIKGANYGTNPNGVTQFYYYTRADTQYDTIEFSYFGSSFWSYQMYDFVSWNNNEIQWTKISKNGASILDFSDVDYPSVTEGDLLRWSASAGAWKSDKYYHNHNAGLEVEPDIVDYGNGTLAVSATNAWFYTDAEQDATTFINIPNSDPISATNDIASYICADRDTASWVKLTAISDIDYLRYIPYFMVFKRSGNNNMHFQKITQYAHGNVELEHKRELTCSEYQREPGTFESISVSSSLDITVNGGAVWAVRKRYVISPVTSATRLFTCVNTGSGWSYTSALSPKINNTQYNAASGTVTLTDTYWTINYLFRGIEDQDHMYLVLGNSEYATKELAQASNYVSSLPTLITSHAMLIGRVIVQKNATSSFVIESAYNTVFVASSAITDHGMLSGLGDDDHSQYYNQTRGDARYAQLTHTQADSSITFTDNTSGNVSTTAHGYFPKLPASAGKYLRDDMSWQSVTAGAGGSTTQVQFNNTGALSGTPDLIWDPTVNHLEVGLSSNNGAICLGSGTGDPVAEPGELIFYAKTIANRVMPKWIGPAGIDTPFQALLGFNGIRGVGAGTGTTAATCMTAMFTAFTNTGTAAQVAMTSGTIKGRMRGQTLVTSAATGNVASHFTPNYEAYGEGGYFFVIRFGIAGTIRTGQRGFAGLWASTTIATNVDPTTNVTSKVGIGYNPAATTGNWKMVAANGTTAMTAIDLGASFPINTTDVMELVLFCPPGSASIGYRVTNMTTGAQTSGTLTGNVPAATTLLAVHHWVTNNAQALTATLYQNKWYLESDY